MSTACPSFPRHVSEGGREAKKDRFIILDALRGIAGLCVPLFHVFEPLERRAAHPVPSWVGHGYLAVEFFLLLMGYMLGYAYDRRWAEGMTLAGFFRRRLVRLHPLVVSGVLLGLAVALAQPEDGIWMPWLKGTGTAGVVGLALWSATMVPVIGWKLLNPFNACSWTLYYEYAGNLLYALGVRKLNRGWLLAGAAVSAFFWIAYVLQLDLNALFGTQIEVFDKIAKSGRWSIAGGWSDNGLHVYTGFVRMLFPLFFGLLLSRLPWRIRIPWGAFAVAVIVFAAVLFTPCRPAGGGRCWVDAVFEIAALTVVFPTLILIGVGNSVDASKPVARVSTFFAELSYPLYMSHYMFMYVYGWWVRKHSLSCTSPQLFAICTCLYLSLIGIAYLVRRFWDRPIQRVLTGRRDTDRTRAP